MLQIILFHFLCFVISGVAQILSDKNKLWTAQISYVVNPALDDVTKTQITKALQWWSEDSCIKFEKHETGANLHHYIQFQPGHGCGASVIGKGPHPYTNIVLGPNCKGIGRIAHEVGHVLGLVHTQCRPDRNQHVHINENAIGQGLMGQFTIKNGVTTLGFPYDFGSIMHYALREYRANSDINEIDVLDPKYQNTIGQRDELSFLDKKMVALSYCPHVCTGANVCHKAGYRNPANCSECICPAGLSGPTCDLLENSTIDCGGVLDATSEPKFTNFDFHHKKMGDVYCNWMIKSTKPIHLQLESFQFPKPLQRGVCAHYMEIKLSNYGSTGPRFCGPFSDEKRVVMTGPSGFALLRVKIETSHRQYKRRQHSTFKLKYWV